MSKRPKLQDIQASENLPSKPEKIRRTAQPGNVLFPRAIFYRNDLHPSTRLVAGWLYDHLKPGTNTATGSQTTIAQELGLTKLTVLRAIKELWETHIIMTTEKHNKTGGGFYLSYEMRIFPSDQPRKQKPTHKKYTTKIMKPKRAKKHVLKPETECQVCYGTGWHILENRQGAKPCICKTTT